MKKAYSAPLSQNVKLITEGLIAESLGMGDLDEAPVENPGLNGQHTQDKSFGSEWDF